MEESKKIYLADLLAKELTVPRNNRPSNFIITTPPGSGKTFAVRKLLFPRIYSEKSSLLYVVNRTALARQITRMRNEYAEQHPLEASYLLSHVHVVTYQKIEAMLSYNAILDYPYNIACYRGGYICLDEFHYVWHDSLFNPKTLLSYDFFTQATSATRFFMSASLTSDMISALENSLMENCRIGDYTSQCRSKGNLLFTSKVYKEINSITPDYSYLNLEAFSTIEELPELLKTTSGKTIVFVSSIKEGNKLISQLQESLPELKCDFLCSEYRNNTDMAETMSTIVNRDTFDCDILVTTTVIDNGINLRNNAIKNIVILTYNKVDLEQCLSRRRVDKDDEIINLFLCRRSVKNFTDLKQQYERIWRCYETMSCLSPFSCLQKYFEDHDNSRFYDKIGLYRSFPYGQVFQINHLSFEYLCYELQSINEIISRFSSEGKNAFLDIQRSWLSPAGTLLPYSDHTLASTTEQFISMLNDISNQEMASQELTNWLKKDDVKKCIRQLSPDKIYASKPVTKEHLKKLLETGDFGFTLKETPIKPKKTVYTIIKS